MTPEQAKETLPEIKRLAHEAGRDPDRLEFSVLLVPQGDGPTVDTIKQYAEAGVTRLVVAALASASGSGLEAMKSVAPIVERAQRV